MLARSLDSLGAADLDKLIASGVAEHRTLEYKRDLPAAGKDARREFLADISSFANAQGGDILFGIDAPRGIAGAITGARDIDRDAVQLALEDLLQAGIEPRIPGLRSHWIDCGERGLVFIVRVPASPVAPHRVIFASDNRFFGRKSNGKYPMDTAELRQAFAAGEILPQRLRALHLEAVDAARRGSLPAGLGDEPRAVLSLIPVGLFREARDIEVTPENALLPFRTGPRSFPIPMIEGILFQNVAESAADLRSYALTYRSGRIDTAWTIGRIHDPLGREEKLISVADFEGGLADGAISGAARLSGLGVEGPWQVAVTLSGISEYRLAFGDSAVSDPAWRDEVSLPPMIGDTLNLPALDRLKRMFWLAFGVDRPHGIDRLAGAGHAAFG